MASRESQAANVIDLTENMPMASPSWAGKTSFEISRQVINHVKETGKLPDWFGPSQPLHPFVSPELAGRSIDYPTGFNLRTQPRGDAKISFATLRDIADTWDLFRLLVETRKDQVCKLAWSISPRDGKMDAEEPRAKAISEFFRFPDKENPWETWLRMLLDDLLVIDAPAIYPRFTNGGELYSLDPIDGATIKRVIDDFGRTPIEPYPAYQQILHGVPAFDYTRDELIYMPRNRRTNRIYGVSPIENILTTVSLALNRQAYQLGYYENGSTPDMIMSVPKDWSTAQIKEFKQYWDALLEGNMKARRGTMFVPESSAPINTKDAILKDGFDEWVARIACFAFNQSVTPFVAQVNRATAEVAQEQAAQDGLASTMQWVKTLLDAIINKFFKSPDLHFVWGNTRELDPETANRIDDLRVRNDTLTINEVRKKNGDEPIEGGDEPWSKRQAQFAAQASPFAALGAPRGAPVAEGDTQPTDTQPDAPVAPGDTDAAAVAAVGEVSAAALNGAQVKSLQEIVAAVSAGQLPAASANALIAAAFPVLNPEQIDAILAPLANFTPEPDEPAPNVDKPAPVDETAATVATVDAAKPVDDAAVAAVVDEVEKLRKAKVAADTIASVLAELAQEVVDQIGPKIPTVAKAADGSSAMAEAMIKALKLTKLEKLLPLLETELANSFLPIFKKAFLQVGGDEASDAFNLSTELATAWAKEHAAELVGYDLPEATRDMLRGTITQAIDEGWTPYELADNLMDTYTFSADRARVIAETEQTMAVMQGELQGWKESGVVTGSVWLLTNNENECELCAANAAAGEVALGEPFPSGATAPPQHPNCQCSLSPVVAPE